jgi:flagellar motor switch protein FliN/FliY
VLARDLGLGDGVRAGQEWSVDDGDSTLASAISGGAEGHLFLAVNDGVSERLLADPAVLQAAFIASITAAGIGLGGALTGGENVFATTDTPNFIVEITDAGVVTSLVGLTLPIMVPQSAATDFSPTSFDDMPEPDYSHSLGSLTVLDDVELLVTAELGRTTMAVRDLLSLTPGMVVEIDRAAGAPIDLLVNGRRIAAGEVVVIDEEFGIRITDIAPIGDRRR